MTNNERTNPPWRYGLTSRQVELSSAALALVLAIPIAALLFFDTPLGRESSGGMAIAESVFLGPLVALVGAWLDARRGQGLGLILLGLGVLLALDGAIATRLLGLPLFALVLASLVAGVARRHNGSSLERLND